MIYDDQFFEIEDQIQEVLVCLQQSNTYQNYLENKKKLYADEEVQIVRADFLQKKEAFERIEAYGSYAPDHREKRRALRKAKRVLDVHPLVAEFRFSETELQGILDEMTIKIAHCISDDIKVDTGNPFFETKSSCGGKCHVG
ncbi:YlbF family regulator [Enterococcus saccharolyticus]|uniref:Transcriptional regulator n=1 Tax=Candidatus Enterococcus willemsii TaxID=1857215 RepID=A0ABQ6YXY2_9ENTE|nr:MULTISPECIES: YlbF family regulator [Enterococcus]KAF1302760.1 transcriptional regulator [Enterococcus sp. CU12B]MCD5002438.1 YlbF family regulator [Enterococcus saccharolyticus]